MGVSAASILNRLLSHKNLSARTQPTGAKAVATTILKYLEEGRLRKAVSVLFDSPFPFPHPLYARLFQICSSTRALVEARKVESHLVTFCPTPPIFLLNRAIEAYGKCGCLVDARELFEEMPQRDGGSWNAMITAYTKNGFALEALNLFLNMNKSGVYATEITLASVLGSCGSVLALHLSRQVHGHIVKSGFVGNVILESSLVDVYGKCRLMNDARSMFDEIQNRNDVSWNVIVRRYLEVDDGKLAVSMFFQMFREAVMPLSFTFSNALIACSSMAALIEGRQIHGIVVKVGLEGDEVISSSLIDMYVKCGTLENAHQVFIQPSSRNLISWTSMVYGYAMSGEVLKARELFNEMPERNVISWNAMLAGYIHSGQWEEALDFVHLMHNSIKDVDHVTLRLILNVCTGLLDVERGKQVHGFIYRIGFYANLYIGNALLDMYGKCGNLKSARVWFYQMSQWRDEVSWNALLTTYARHGMSEQAMTIFSEMQWEAAPSKFTFATLLAACANTFALDQGKQIHGFMVRNNYEIDIAVSGALVDMYCKCRQLEYALKVFENAASRDVVLWNSIILGCCHNRRGMIVIELFQMMMMEKGINPDHVTFQGILLACVYENLVELGRQYFDSMSDKFCIIPRLEHYECMIELYGRHGNMDELEKFIINMPFDPTVPMLEKVLDACRKHGHSRLGEWVAIRLNEQNLYK
ncbi:pentatricopeptide repeat-containing protein At3g26540 [Cucurbita maxima]|uniref:Pentatricopeptide repeat-containing protein At3g26540 n=1 Tax=Cucurbita maxima TaxID=3661 RepID=A0A6J1K1B7_CUCMA|nr:pentatricopeptide repeat-containing protein At3g26540 [Cucurbita maxima]